LLKQYPTLYQWPSIVYAGVLSSAVNQFCSPGTPSSPPRGPKRKAPDVKGIPRCFWAKWSLGGLGYQGPKTTHFQETNGSCFQEAIWPKITLGSLWGQLSSLTNRRFWARCGLVRGEDLITVVGGIIEHTIACQIANGDFFGLVA
jgi:hypothetical protein